MKYRKLTITGYLPDFVQLVDAEAYKELTRFHKEILKGVYDSSSAYKLAKEVDAIINKPDVKFTINEFAEYEDK